MTYTFSIQIDDEQHSLTAEKGISMVDVADILASLYPAIDVKENALCSLSSIRGNCYALDFSTENIDHLERFKIVHRNIEELPMNQLSADQLKYARTLNKILKDKYYLRAFDNDKKQIASIRDLNAEKEIAYYYVSDTVYGIVSELGARSLDRKKHITLDTGKKDEQYKISVSKDQDLELKPFYRTNKLRVEIRQKRSMTDHRNLSSEMIGFTVVDGKSLSDNLAETGYVDFELIRGAHTMDDIINRIYGDS